MKLLKKIPLPFLTICSLLSGEFMMARSPEIHNEINAVTIAVTTTDPTCNLNNGIISIQALSGVPPFTYSITGHAPRPYGFFSYLFPGTYVVLVTDATNATATQTVTLTNIFSAPTATAVVNSFPTSCTSHDVSITVTGNGGLPPYLFTIDQVTYQSGNFFSGLTAGLYRYAVKDANGCVSPVSIFNNLTIPENCPIHQNGVILSYNCDPFRCFLGLVNVSGGTPPYMYSLDGINYQPNNSFTNGVPQGLYTIWVKDATGLILLYTVAVKDHCTPAFNVATIVQQAVCGSNGSITVVASNGTSPYLYSLDGTNFQASNSFTGLVPGAYTITVKDANGLLSSVLVNIDNSCITVNASAFNSSCGNSNGSIQATASNGTAPYQYSIDGVNFNTTGFFSGLAAGNYTVTVKDAVNHAGTAVVVITNVAGPSITSVTTLPTGCLNQNGSLSISAQGTALPLVYSIDGSSFGPTPFFSSLGTGTYPVIVKDANGCTVSSQGTVTLVNNLAVDAGQDSAICEGGSMLLNGSSNGQSFSWTTSPSLSNPLSYNPLVNPSVTTTYYLNAVTGACTKKDSVTVHVNAAPIADAGQTKTLCFGQSATLQGNGGVSYYWQPSTYLSNPNVVNPSVINPLASITYLLNVTDAKGCTSLKPASVFIAITPPAAVFAGNDTFVVKGQPLQLMAKDINGSGFTQFQWTPSIGLDNGFIQSPVATLNTNMRYVLSARTPAGCKGLDTIDIKTFSNVDIFVPNAFTPNGDGKNDLLKAIPVGIKIFRYFAVYNRYGSRIFYTTDPAVGWDGKTNTKEYNTNGFTWIAAGVDYLNRDVLRKGSFILIQ